MMNAAPAALSTESHGTVREGLPKSADHQPQVNFEEPASKIETALDTKEDRPRTSAFRHEAAVEGVLESRPANREMFQTAADSADRAERHELANRRMDTS